MKYTPLDTTCDFCLTTLREAMRLLRAQSNMELVYTVHCSRANFDYARLRVREANGELPPQINLVLELHFSPEEWCVSDSSGRAFGSPGVT